MSSGKSSYFMFFGIIFGLCLGLVIRNHRALEIVKRCDSTASDRRKFCPLYFANTYYCVVYFGSFINS